MKKLLLLGGSAQQVVAIEKAKEMGYYTILCDFLPDNPGQYVADKFYLVSTTDKEAILEVAKKENIEGVVAYASDPAAPTAAYVAEKLALPGNSYEAVEILCNKDRFREFLKNNHFCTPKAKRYTNLADAENDIKNNVFKLPVIVKPVDSSSSKGVTVLQSKEGIETALEHAFSYSRCRRIIIEEFIEKKHPFLIGGDIFVINGEIVMWGLMNCHRDSNVNPLVPVGKSYPLQLEEHDFNYVKMTLQRLVDKLKIKNGAMNVELVVDKNDRVYPIDIGPRNGGNMIPELLRYIFDVDVVGMTIQCAMGEPITMEKVNPKKFYATYNLHTEKTGAFEGMIFSNEIKKNMIRKCIYKQEGDAVEYFDNAAKALGIVFLKFESQEEMMQVMENIHEQIEIRVS